MVTSLAQILERKRREKQSSQQNVLQAVTKGQLGAANTAAKIVENRRLKESQEFNPLNALVSGGTAFIASGGNPLAAGVAAAGSSRGRKFKPLESAISGGTSGLTTGSTSVADLAKPENAGKLTTVVKQAGAPKKVTKALDTYAKSQAAAEALKAKKAKENQARSDKIAAADKLSATKVSEADKDRKLKKELATISAKKRATKDKTISSTKDLKNKKDELVDYLVTRTNNYLENIKLDAGDDTTRLDDAYDIKIDELEEQKKKLLSKIKSAAERNSVRKIYNDEIARIQKMKGY